MHHGRLAAAPAAADAAVAFVRYDGTASCASAQASWSAGDARPRVDASGNVTLQAPREGGSYYLCVARIAQPLDATLERVGFSTALFDIGH